MYHDTASIRQFNARDAEIQSKLVHLGVDPISFVNAVSGSEGDALILGMSQIIHLSKGALNGEIHCLGRLVEMCVSSSNPPLFRRSSTSPLLPKLESFWDFYGYCGCANCHSLYNTMPPNRLCQLGETTDFDTAFSAQRTVEFAKEKTSTAGEHVTRVTARIIRGSGVLEDIVVSGLESATNSAFSVRMLGYTTHMCPPQVQNVPEFTALQFLNDVSFMKRSALGSIK